MSADSDEQQSSSASSEEDEAKAERESTGVYVTELRPTDVLLGRGTGPSMNEGNVSFREAVDEMKASYISTPSRKQKKKIVMRTIKAIKAKNGRFLNRLRKAEAKMLGLTQKVVYEVVPDSVAVEKTKQAIRYIHYKRDAAGSNGTAAYAGSSTELRPSESKEVEDSDISDEGESHQKEKTSTSVAPLAASPTTQKKAARTKRKKIKLRSPPATRRKKTPPSATTSTAGHSALLPRQEVLSGEAHGASPPIASSGDGAATLRTLASMTGHLNPYTSLLSSIGSTPQLLLQAGSGAGGGGHIPTPASAFGAGLHGLPPFNGAGSQLQGVLSNYLLHPLLSAPTISAPNDPLLGLAALYNQQGSLREPQPAPSSLGPHSFATALGAAGSPPTSARSDLVDTRRQQSLDPSDDLNEQHRLLREMLARHQQPRSVLAANSILQQSHLHPALLSLRAQQEQALLNDEHRRRMLLASWIAAQQQGIPPHNSSQHPTDDHTTQQ